MFFSKMQEGHLEPNLTADPPYQAPQYHPQIENHIFIIVEQVCVNALRHSGANEILNSGNLTQVEIFLEIIEICDRILLKTTLWIDRDH